jgi:hypothetical protein
MAHILMHRQWLSVPPLQFSSVNGYFGVEELLMQRDADIGKRYESPRTPLDQASSDEQLEITCVHAKHDS